ncbi:MAG: helix-turn-helix domain-containing protein [Anaerolineae bacterium]
MSSAQQYGELVRSLRSQLGKSLRQFCLDNGFDAITLSRIERGIPPEPSPDLAKCYARALGLEQGSAQWAEFLALEEAASSEPMPKIEEETLLRRLPLLFRTDKGEPVSGDKVDRLIDHIRRSDLGL